MLVLAFLWRGNQEKVKTKILDAIVRDTESVMPGTLGGSLVREKRQEPEGEREGNPKSGRSWKRDVDQRGSNNCPCKADAMGKCVEHGK
ncbi:unnamed protein product [Allacma fusca]|uniref:Uncharacterized protein n=1 Tax=Allacma fusca TaxID=39272 RepID=A0A8J2PAK9_9HEXA|nr:unnamed protein product [Allacma fusca]